MPAPVWARSVGDGCGLQYPRSPASLVDAEFAVRLVEMSFDGTDGQEQSVSDGFGRQSVGGEVRDLSFAPA